MNHLFNLLLLTVLLINLAGLAAGGARLTRLPYGLAKAFTVLTGCMIFFFIEHFHGFRALGWLMPFSTAFSLWLLWKQRAQLRTFAGGEAAFLFGFGYVMLWRYFYPDINASSEKIADLLFVASYLQGGTLPVPDLWLHPYKLTQYYSFQHYAAGLLGRILHVPAGTAYNVGYAVVVGLVMAPAYEYIKSFTRNRANQTIILSALMLGGSGACLFTPMMIKDETLFSSMRFIGGAATDRYEELKPMGIAVQKLAYGMIPQETPTREAHMESILEMPMEIFSYVVQLGDFHAPLGGYVLLAVAVAAFGVLRNEPRQRWAWAALMGTVPLSIAVNTWNLPFQSVLVLGVIAFVWRYRGRPDLVFIVGVSLVAWVLFYPYFSYFLTRTIGTGMSIKLVNPEQHAPFILYLIQLWPVYALVILCWFAVPKDQKELRWLPMLIVAYLIVMELLNVDDLYSGRFDRFNTTLKWWPWVGALATLLLAPINLSVMRRQIVVRVGTAAVLFSMLFYVFLLGKTWWQGDKYAKGQLDGAAYMRRENRDPNAPQNINIRHSILNYLEAQPWGVILEAPKSDAQAFIENGALPLFTNKPTVFGWASHEQLWRGYQRDIEQRWNRSREFFRGDLADPLEYLAAHEVRYIVWPGTDVVDRALFDKISAQIKDSYHFVRFDEANPTLGIWVRN